MNPAVAAPPVLVARVVPDVTGLDKQFDYLVPEALAGQVQVGSRVRVPLHGRRVGGWVVALGAPDPELPVDRLVPIAKWSGTGPSAELVDLAAWAAVRWGTNRLRPFLVAASPPGMVSTRHALRPASHAAGPSGVWRLSPSTDPLPLVLEAAAAGPALVLHPAHGAARALANRLRKEGVQVALVPDEWSRAALGVDVVVGSRVAAWAPCPGMATVVVLDEHDESYQEERTPTWHARDVVIERARRQGAGCRLVSPAPSITALHWAGDRFHRLPVGDEHSGWPVVEIVDRTREEPWKRSLLTSPLIQQLRRPGTRVVCVINTTGRARLLACRSCRALQRCERCEAAVAQDDAGQLVCRRCGTVRPAVCQQCGSSAMALMKLGVTRLREELEAAAGRPVVAVTGQTDVLPPADIYVGTEAVLHRVRGADVVALLDIDAELLAPRYRAAEQAMALLVRAARLVGPRAAGGRILVQTFLPQHEVLQAAVLADPGRLAHTETDRRRVLGLPPFRAIAALSGTGAAEFAAATGLELAASGHELLVRADDWMTLGDVLTHTPRPRSSRIRIEVDPAR